MNTTSTAQDSTSSTPRDQQPVANLLTIAGIDPSGGAGIMADVKTFSALGTYACAVVCALTAQNTQHVSGIHEVPPSFIKLQLDTLFSDVRIDYAKIGMLGNAAAAKAVADTLAPLLASGQLPGCVLDPVMISKGKDILLPMDAIEALVDFVLPLATVITPNLPEAAILVGRRAPENLDEMRVVAEHVRKLLGSDGQRWVLLKGGHLTSDPVDLLYDGEQMIEMPAVRIDTRNLHGTGCTLAAALAALIPQSPDVPTAARAAKDYLLKALQASDQLSVGRPDIPNHHGPVHHFHQLWH
ncbi:MAG: bifunctional hydroxymethylpyrimidine kinase/phosphomethylpyrimidine kinase [Lautropia sp.]|nr:bifunctional hydroxymethylpyrimidine kinase/phosphomethylpyrimidine kinase [Lautropia sp.]